MSKLDPAQMEQILQAIASAPSLYGFKRELPFFYDNGEEPWDHWKERFLTVANREKWTDAEQRQYLMSSMKGSAKEKTKDLPIYMFSSIYSLLHACGQAFPTPESSSLVSSLFKQAQQGPQESITEWYHKIRGYYTSAYDLLDYDISTTLRDRFIEGLRDLDLMTYVINARPSTPPEAYHLAVSYIEPMPLPKGRAGCWHCGLPGHLRRTCPTRKLYTAPTPKGYSPPVHFVNVSRSSSSPYLGSEETIIPCSWNMPN